MKPQQRAVDTTGMNPTTPRMMTTAGVQGKTHYLYMRQLRLVRVDLGFVENQQ